MLEKEEDGKLIFEIFHERRYVAAM